VRAQGPEHTVIRSGIPWMDTSGNRIYAGGANIYFENGLYYLVGEGAVGSADRPASDAALL
jgi:hypothetical protein